MKIAPWLILPILVFSLSPAGARSPRIFSEDFSTHRYCDTLNTSAWWDTLAGELKLPGYQGDVLTNHYTGDAFDVELFGNYCLVANGSSPLVILDISDPADPISVGSAPTPGFSRGLALNGYLAYVANGDGGLQIFDITDPSNPINIGSSDIPTSAYDVDVDGKLAFVAEYLYGLRIFDISVPATPVLVGDCPILGNPSKLVVVGDYAYVAADASDLQIVDISEPSNPVIIGSYTSGGARIRDVVIRDKLAICAAYQAGMIVIDVADPTNPQLVGSCPNVAFSWGVAVAGTYAYVAQEDQKLGVVDLQDPSAPLFIENIDLLDRAWRVAVAGEYAYVAAEEAGVHTLRVATPLEPPRLYGQCFLPGTLRGIALKGDYAYIGRVGYQLLIVDIHDPANPYLAASADVLCEDFDIAGNYAYVAGLIEGLKVIDISSPTTPFLAGEYVWGYEGNPYTAAVSGNHVYMSGYGVGFVTLDNHDPTAPFPLGSTPNGSLAPNGLVLNGNYAYDLDPGQLRVVDISDPASPVEVTTVSPPTISNDMVIADNIAYVADGEAGLRILDLGDPASPSLVSTFDTPGDAMGLFVEGQRLYVADGTALLVLDVSDAVNPVSIDSLPAAGFYNSIAVDGNFAYVSDPSGALHIIEVLNRSFDLERNIAQSLPFPDEPTEIARARIFTAQVDSIAWELSTDAGENWSPAESGGDWIGFPGSGSQLLWRAGLHYLGGGIGPLCDELSIEWLYSWPLIDQISDVPDDGGGWVRLFWRRSGFDFADALLPIYAYNIHRRIDDLLLRSRVLEDGVPVDRSDTPGLKSEESYSPLLGQEGVEQVSLDDRVFVVSQARGEFPPGIWETVGLVFARQEDLYIAQAPSVGDSSYYGIPWSVYCVSAHTTDPLSWWVSPPDSGYSVDNSGVAAPPPGTSAVPVLHQNLPNPFNPTTTLYYEVPLGGARMRLEVLDVHGRRLRVLAEGFVPEGHYAATWDGRDAKGRAQAGGVYLCRLRTERHIETRKMLLLE